MNGTFQIISEFWAYPQKAVLCCNVSMLLHYNHSNHTDSWAESKNKVSTLGTWIPERMGIQQKRPFSSLCVGVQIGKWITSNISCSSLQSIQIPEADIQNQCHHEQNVRGSCPRTRITSSLVSAFLVPLFIYEYMERGGKCSLYSKQNVVTVPFRYNTDARLKPKRISIAKDSMIT